MILGCNITVFILRGYREVKWEFERNRIKNFIRFLPELGRFWYTATPF